MTVIFPGNYVAHLNAYRDQGVFATPGVEFYQIRGISMVTDALSGGGSLDLVIPSPDLRQDDKPRLDRPFVVPAGATVYRTAITPVNLKSAGTDTIAVAGLTTPLNLAASVAAEEGVFPEEGSTSVFDGYTTVSKESADATITASYSGVLEVDEPNDQSYVIVEVCYFVDGEAPTSDDVHVPYKTEAGQGY